jgi:type II secretory pathway component GspD/PulD (secretin)
MVSHLAAALSLCLVLAGFGQPREVEEEGPGLPPQAPAATAAPAPGAAPSRPAPAQPPTEAPGEAKGEAPKPAAPAEQVLTIRPSAHGWTVHAVNVDAHELLTAFARQAGLRLIVDDTVNRRITIHIADRPAEQVLSLIVDAYGFSSAQVNGIYVVSEGIPKNPSSYLLSEIASVTTKYVAPQQAQKLLPLFLQGHVKVNTDQNALVLSGPRPVLEKFRQDVRQFDVPAQQIMLDVLVVEFTDIDSEEFRAALGLSNANFGVTTDSLTGQLVLSAVAELPTEFFARLNALVAQQRARVRANPRIATVSGQTASIFIGVQQYLSTPVTLEGYRAVNYIDAGVRLEMTPLTGGGGEIILDLNEEISTLSRPDEITKLPTKTTRSATTTVRVQAGQTIIIGGLRQRESREVRRALPILSQIPLVGGLFKSKRLEHMEVDLAVFITARLLSPEGHLPAAEEAQIRQLVPPEGRSQR